MLNNVFEKNVNSPFTFYQTILPRTNLNTTCNKKQPSVFVWRCKSMTHKLRQTTILHCPSCLLHLIQTKYRKVYVKVIHKNLRPKQRIFSFHNFFIMQLIFHEYTWYVQWNVSNLEELITQLLLKSNLIHINLLCKVLTSFSFDVNSNQEFQI